MTRPPWHLVLLVLAVLAGSALRIAWNDVQDFYGDETVYRHYTQLLVDGGWPAYPGLVRTYLQTPGMHPYPTPLRYGHLALTRAACALSGRCDFRTLAWLSTAAGIATIGLGYLLGRRVAGPMAGAVTALLVATSPLHLALGRRALQDELAAAVAISALLLALAARDDDRPWVTAAAVAALALALAVKELFAFFWPALIGAYVVGRSDRRPRWRDAALFVLPPVLYVLGFVVAARSLGDFFRLLAVQARTAGALQYSMEFEAGPPYRPLLDLFVLAPGTFLLAVGACAVLLAERQREQRELQGLAVFLWLVFLAFVSLPKNLRYLLVADTVLRPLAAWGLVARFLPSAWAPAGAAVALGINAAVELALFRQVFIVGAVYDPTAAYVLRALKIIPP